MKMMTLVLIAGIAGCTSNVKSVPTIATQPVVVHDTEVRYVPIRAELTAHIDDPGTSVVPGVTPWGQVLKGDQACGAALEIANARFAEIARVQGTSMDNSPKH
jgi:hypothetical protein